MIRTPACLIRHGSRSTPACTMQFKHSLTRTTSGGSHAINRSSQDRGFDLGRCCPESTDRVERNAFGHHRRIGSKFTEGTLQCENDEVPLEALTERARSPCFPGFGVHKERATYLACARVVL